MNIEYLLIGGCLITVFLIYSFVRKRNFKRKYGIELSGGRGGNLIYKKDEKVSLIEYELLAGDINFVLYDTKLNWTEPDATRLTQEEKNAFYSTLNLWAKESKLSYELSSEEKTVNKIT